MIWQGTNSFSQQDRESFLTQGAILSLSKDNLVVGWGSGAWHPSLPPGGEGFFLPDYFLESERPWWQPEKCIHLKKQQLMNFLSTLAGSLEAEASEFAWQGPDEPFFAAQFGTLRSLLERGDLQKGVPYTYLTAAGVPRPEVWIRSLLAALGRVGEERTYAYWNSSEGLLGATPELLCESSSDQPLLKTFALAGTVPKSTYRPGCLLADAKLRREHQLVIEDICQKLKPFGPVRTGVTEEVMTVRLVHLRTPIEVASTRPIGAEESVRLLHPTAALGVFPANTSGLDWLRQQRPSVPRGRFGAPFGFQRGSGDYSVVVAIRGVQWGDSRTWISAGCGVIAESELEGEWREVNEKIHAVRSLLAL